MRDVLALREAAERVVVEAHNTVKAANSARRERKIRTATARFAALFRAQGKLFVTDHLPKFESFFRPPEIKEAAYDGDLVDAFADIFGKTRAQAEKAMVDTLFDAVSDGYLEQAESFGLEGVFTMGNERATSWAARNAAKRVTEINKSTQKGIRDLISNGLRDGRDYGSVAREIRDTFDGFTTARAMTVAVTENAYAYESGSRDLVDDIEQQGITMEKSWSTVGGDECDVCYENAAAGWIPVDGTFPSGDDNPPAHPNCRCACLYQVAEGGEE